MDESFELQVIQGAAWLLRHGLVSQWPRGGDVIDIVSSHHESEKDVNSERFVSSRAGVHVLEKGIFFIC